MQNWKQLSYLQVGSACCLPILLIGYLIASQLTLILSTLIIAGGNIFLFLLALIYTRLITERDLTTIECANLIFGKKGTYLCGLGLYITMIGWAAIQLHITTHFILEKLKTSALLIESILLCITYFIAQRELKALARFNQVIFPVLLCGMLYMVFMALKSPLVSPFPTQLTPMLALILVMNACLSVIFDLPTFFRKAKSPKDIRISLALLFLLAVPLIEGMGMVIAIHRKGAEQNDLINLLSQQTPFLFFIFFILSGISTNCGNLYSASITLNKLIKKINFNSALLISGFISAGLALFNIEENYFSYIEMINLTITAMGFMLVASLLLNKEKIFQLTNYQKKIHDLFFMMLLIIFIIIEFFR